MKAAIGLVLVFTGLTVGYLVLTGRLPMAPGIVNPPGINDRRLTTDTSRGITNPPGINQRRLNNSSGGGEMQASVPDSYARGQITAVKPIRAGGY